MLGVLFLWIVSLKKASPEEGGRFKDKDGDGFLEERTVTISILRSLPVPLKL